MEDFYATYGRDLNLDKYVRLAARICNRPSAILHLLGDVDQHTLAQYGTTNDVGYCMPRRDSICDYTAYLNKGELLSIRDTVKDDRVKHLPGVVGPPHFRWYLGTPIHSSDKKLIGALCVLDRRDDTTEATDDMKASLVDLADCVSTELALRADCNMALRAKKDFLTSVSHELRDPMHGINIGLELLAASRSNAADETLAIETVRKCSMSLEGLVDKILCINDKEPTNALRTSTMEIVNLVETLEIVLDSAWVESTLAEGQSMTELEPVLHIQSNLLGREFLLDRRILSKIVSQLFGNAIKFTRKGMITVQLRTEVCSNPACDLKDSEHDTLYLSVKDTGCGMSADFVMQAFDDFSQEDPLKVGVGLGLSVVKKMVNEIGGDISINTTVGIGSSVDVKLCLDRADSSNDVPQASGKFLQGRTFAISATISAALTETFVSYCTSYGMEQVDMSLAQCIIGSVGEALGRPCIVIAHDQQQRRRSVVSGSAVVGITLPIGPHKLYQALQAALSQDGKLACATESDDISHDMRKVTLESETSSPKLAASITPYTNYRSTFHNRTCLVVDDNPINVKILCAVLKKHGYLHSYAKDGIEAVQAVKARPKTMPFDVILMDINMPNMNGVEATALIREYQAKNEIESSLVIAVSGCSDAEQKSAMARGLKHFFKKPVDLRRLTQFMDELLEH